MISNFILYGIILINNFIIFRHITVMLNRRVHNKWGMTRSGLICNFKPLSLMVTLHTKRFNLTKKSMFCPYSLLLCFVWISQKMAIISLHSIN
jgi:hypothetical protein